MPMPFESSMDFFEILPKIALKYSINEYLVPYATVAKGYNSGGFNSTFEREEDRSFHPEHSWNYEAGMKAKWLQQRIYANLAFFLSTGPTSRSTRLCPVEQAPCSPMPENRKARE
jgi:outer membrane receptor protein involved in Fe transport